MKIRMAACGRESSSVLTPIDQNSLTCVILCIARAGHDGDKSRLCAAKLDQDGPTYSIGRGNPFYLANEEKGFPWTNMYIRKAMLRVGDIAKYHIEENQFVYDEKTGSRMVN